MPYACIASWVSAPASSGIELLDRVAGCPLCRRVVPAELTAISTMPGAHDFLQRDASGDDSVLIKGSRSAL